MNAHKSQQEAYNELSYYTLSHQDPSFIHQHIVNAYTAQVADKRTKPISLTFALVGLYLFLEKNFTGRQVQIMHMKMAKQKKIFPSFHLPISRGSITPEDVLVAAPGKERDTMIKKWCMDVWSSYKDNQREVAEFLTDYIYGR